MLFVADGDQKRMHAILFVLDDELGEHYCVIGIYTKVSNPPLRCHSGWHVHYKSLVLFIECSSSHKILHV